MDAIDAALAALTGLTALEGNASAIGDAQEGLIIVPRKSMPEQFVREEP